MSKNKIENNWYVYHIDEPAKKYSVGLDEDDAMELAHQWNSEYSVEFPAYQGSPFKIGREEE